jgi:hypothetical protein
VGPTNLAVSRCHCIQDFTQLCNDKRTWHSIPLGKCSMKRRLIVGNRSASGLREARIAIRGVQSSLPRPIAIGAMNLLATHPSSSHCGSWSARIRDKGRILEERQENPPRAVRRAESSSRWLDARCGARCHGLCSLVWMQGGSLALCSGGRSGLLEVTVGAALRRADRNLLGTRAPCWKPIELWLATKVSATVKSSDETRKKTVPARRNLAATVT